MNLFALLDFELSLNTSQIRKQVHRLATCFKPISGTQDLGVLDEILTSFYS